MGAPYIYIYIYDISRLRVKMLSARLTLQYYEAVEPREHFTS